MVRILLLVLGVLASSSASAQTIVGDRVRLNTGPCVIRSGSGTPEGAVTGNPCDEWHRTDTSQIYKKIAGTGNTGWYAVLGATSATCASFAGCVAAQLTLDTTLFTQKLRTDSAVQLRQYVVTDGAHLEAVNGGGWMPLWLGGGPTRVVGGGLHVGGTSILDPGLGNVQMDGFIGKPGYVSQTTGWRVDALGAADFRYLYTDELHAKAFIADLEQALAGGQIISKSVAQVGAVFTVPAPGSISTLTVKDLPSAANMAVFEAGDHIRLRTFSRAAGSLSITDAWGTVSGYADAADGLQTWQFTRAITNGGAMATATQIAIDSIVLDYGVSGNGFHEVNAIDGLYGVNSPYSQIVTWAGDSPIAANQTVRTRLGNLRGITGVTGEFGLIAGTYAATDGSYIRASNQAFELHGIDLKLWNGTTNVIRLDQATPYWSMGNPAPTTYSSGTGCWSGLDGGVFKWRCGDISGGTHYIAWNGTTLSVAGAITVTSGFNYAGSASPGGSANDTVLVNGVAAATVQGGAARANLGLSATGGVTLPVAATPSGSGLFLGSDFMGYYASGAWRTFMDNAGNFYLGGTGGALQWNGTTLTIAATLSGNGSAITSISGGNITTGTVAAAAIVTNSLTATQIAADAITASELAANSITAADMLANTITAGQIAAGTITATQIATNTITANEIAAMDLSAISATLGTITAGNVTLGSAGYVRQGQTAYNTGTGFWLGDDAGTPKFSIGNPSGNRLTFDGTTLTYVGVGSGLTALNGANVQTDTITATQIASMDLSAISATLGTITAGNVTLGTNGYVRQGQTAYNTGTGFWLGDDAGTPKFSIGVAAGNRLTFDGTTLTYVGTSGSIAGWTLGATSLTSGAGANTVGADSGGSNPAFYAGSATPGSAPFRVTQAGALTATSATITGAITATSGAIGGCSLSATTLTCGGTTLTSSGLASSGALSAISANLGTITAGSVTLGSAGYVRQGQTAYNTGTGFWLGDVSGTPKFSIGVSTGNFLTWDGTSLLVNSKPLTTTTSATGTFTPTSAYPIVYWTGTAQSTIQSVTLLGGNATGDELTVVNLSPSYSALILGSGFGAGAGQNPYFLRGQRVFATWNGSSWVITGWA
jgi:hypothetical protein